MNDIVEYTKCPICQSQDCEKFSCPGDGSEVTHCPDCGYSHCLYFDLINDELVLRESYAGISEEELVRHKLSVEKYHGCIVFTYYDGTSVVNPVADEKECQSLVDIFLKLTCVAQIKVLRLINGTCQEQKEK